MWRASLSPEAAMAHRICGMTRWFEGNFAEARRHLEQGLRSAMPRGDREFVFRFDLDVASTVDGLLRYGTLAARRPRSRS